MLLTARACSKRNAALPRADSSPKIVFNTFKACWALFNEFCFASDLACSNAINSLNTEYEDILEQRDKELGDYNEILNEEKEYNISTVSIDDIPDDVGKDMFLLKLLMNMID